MLLKKSLYNKFVGALIKHGKKSVSKKILFISIYKICKSLKINKKQLFLKIFKSLNCYVELRKIKVKRNTHLVPFAVASSRRLYLVVKWILLSIKEDKRSLAFSDKFTFEIMTLLRGKHSKSLRKKKQNLRLCMQNRSNMHYRW